MTVRVIPLPADEPRIIGVIVLVLAIVIFGCHGAKIRDNATGGFSLRWIVSSFVVAFGQNPDLPM